ncbi:hypothetical protein SCLARK_001681 [Spiroplasma clarkii]|uniref:lipoprotein n=1 Tax=Spiroplasma clarkii TaxID=2139 RepID=UPI000B573CBF|nr:lipoprotein [Spiroplasma clarkii]ARU92147.1 hypothetical protein SCLARK_001681 [Spiroplasma clarkii]
MKKLISILGTVSLASSIIMPVVACRKIEGDKDTTPTNLQNEMSIGAEFMSRLIIAARHENLNFNVNELLSSLITPEGNQMRLPQSYNYNNQQISIVEEVTNYKNS